MVDSNSNPHHPSPTVGGISFTGLLAILFIALKLTHVVDWPWLWVLAPLWVPVLLLVVVLFVLLAVALVRR